MRMLGRMFVPDDGDLAHLARERDLPRTGAREKKYWGSRKARLDQGYTGTCVGHAWTHLIRNGPIFQDTGSSPFDLYRQIVLVDEWTQNDHEAHAADEDLQFGTSVRAGAKVLQSAGVIGEYIWAFDADTAIDWILNHGGGVGGFNWYEGMTGTDAEGFIRPTGHILGGHAVWCFGARKSDGRTTWLNSWGPWGRRGEGTFFLAYEDFQRLLDEDGEFCLPTEIRKE